MALGSTFFRQVAVRMFDRAMDANVRNILTLLEKRPGGTFLDVGCDDGARTLQFARAAGSERIHGVEIVPERAALAAERGIEVVGSRPESEASLRR